jgi:hypothetical protein
MVTGCCRSCGNPACSDCLKAAGADTICQLCFESQDTIVRLIRRRISLVGLVLSGLYAIFAAWIAQGTRNCSEFGCFLKFYIWVPFGRLVNWNLLACSVLNVLTIYIVTAVITTATLRSNRF